MSACNIIIWPHAAVLLTDTKATTEGGIQWNAPKVRTLPWAKLAISVRGYHAALGVFERMISMNAVNYAGAISFIAQNFEKILSAEYDDPAEAHAMRNDLDLYVVGWSDNGPAGFWVSSYQLDRKVQGISQAHISPMVDRDAQRQLAGGDFKAGIPGLMATQAAQHVFVGGWGLVTEVYAVQFRRTRSAGFAHCLPWVRGCSQSRRPRRLRRLVRQMLSARSGWRRWRKVG